MQNGIVQFPTEARWLTGEEYAFMIRHYRAYSMLFPTEIKLGYKRHPNDVYEAPRNGQVYFIKGWHLREFGFPRREDLKKVFKWKKMNFTTDLPKNDPLCSYLVATGRVGKDCFRMHVVVNSQGKIGLHNDVLEYSKKYRESEVLKQLRSDNGKSGGNKSKLLPEDRDYDSERIILCHVLKRSNCPHQPQDK